MIDEKQGCAAPANPLPTDSEIEDATRRLSRKWARPATLRRAAARSQTIQSVSHGRSHTVTVEIKRSPRPRG